MSSDKKNLHILAQALVAFGQGTGSMRVSRDACEVFIDHYEPMIKSKNVVKTWDEDGAQALERVRLIGRLAAQHAISKASSVIRDDHVKTAIAPVEQASATTICSDG